MAHSALVYTHPTPCRHSGRSHPLLSREADNWDSGWHFDKWAAERAENAKKIQQALQRPDKTKYEELETFADDVGPSYIEDEDENEDEEKDPQVPDQLEPNEEEGETVITMADNLPFKSKYNN